MNYHFRIHKEGRGYWAECVELQGCYTQANTLVALRKNMREALNLFLNEPPSSSLVHPLPRSRVPRGKIESVEVNPAIAFTVLLRSLRNTRDLTQAQVAKLLGFKNIYSYQRLESPNTANPALSTLARIKKVFPEFRLDDVLAA